MRRSWKEGARALSRESAQAHVRLVTLTCAAATAGVKEEYQPGRRRCCLSSALYICSRCGKGTCDLPRWGEKAMSPLSDEGKLGCLRYRSRDGRIMGQSAQKTFRFRNVQ
eukprot:4631028-Ditylum_brightwellii.AAC.2